MLNEERCECIIRWTERCTRASHNYPRALTWMHGSKTLPSVPKIAKLIIFELKLAIS